MRPRHLPRPLVDYLYLLIALPFAFAKSNVSTSDDLIPRSMLFDDLKYETVTLSPDGQQVAFLTSNEFGVKNIYVKCVACDDPPYPVTFENRSQIVSFCWTGVTNLILYSRDRDGDENYGVFKINITNPSPLNPIHTIYDRPGVMAILLAISDRIIIGLNDDKDPSYHNIYEVDLVTNEMIKILQNRRFALKEISIDSALQIRLVAEETEDCSLVYYRPADDADPRNLTSEPYDWVEYYRVPPEDRASMLPQPIGFTDDNQRIYWLWAAGSDLGQLVVHDFGQTNKNEVIHKAKHSQILSVTFHPTRRTVIALTEMYHYKNVYWFETILEDKQYLMKFRPSVTPNIEGISHDFNTWLIRYDSSDQPPEYVIYHRKQKRIEFLFTTRPALADKMLNKMIGFNFTASDGFKVQAYLSLPPNTSLIESDSVNSEPDRYKLANLGILPVHPQKLVLYVHGGPQYRDYYGFNDKNAWLTNRGYAVLQVNFRGSGFLGKNYENAGDGEWGGKMQNDMLDAVNFLVKHGVVDRQKVAIMGDSYGGYATLIGLSLTPDFFACGIDIVGPTNLITLQETIPPYWASLYKSLIKKMGGDSKTTAGKKFLRSRSPFYSADKIRKPLLVIHGANDSRVKRNESDQIVKELRRKGIPVTYIIFPDEGHEITKSANKLAMAGFIEDFLHQCLGGQLEPFRHGQYNSSAVIPSDRISRSNNSVV